MKVKIEVDCTPQEARQFLGLPEVAPMQERLLLEAEERLKHMVKNMDAKALGEMWLPNAAKGFENLMQLWSNYGTKMTRDKD